MKVLQIPNYIYPHIGGIEQTARDILNALAVSEQTEQRVICFNDGDRKNVFDEVDGVPVVRCGTVTKLFSQSISLSYGKLLKKTVKEFAPDVIVFHYPNPLAAHFLLKTLKKYPQCKLIVWWHLDITKQKLLGKLFRGQSKRLLRRAAKVVATSPNYAEGSEYLRSCPEKIGIIPSCINEKRLAMTEQAEKRCAEIRSANEGKTVLFAMGRHVAHKGFDHIIKAAKLLDDSYKIYIAGEGECTPLWKDMAGDDERIEFLGRVSDDEMKAYMSACDIYLFPSLTKNEAFGLALAEAMYFGKPAVTFTIEGSGVNYVSLNGVTGIEAENGNTRSFAEAIRTLAKDPALRKQYGDAAKQRVEDRFLYRSFAERVRELLEKV